MFVYINNKMQFDQIVLITVFRIIMYIFKKYRFNFENTQLFDNFTELFSYKISNCIFQSHFAWI